MLLNAEEIKSRKLLKGIEDKHFKDASYNLTAGKIITPDGKEVNSCLLAPRGIVLIVSKEIFALPENIIGYTTVKNSLSSQGIMAINVGLVDPGWNKPISSAIINFGGTKALIQLGDEFLRMTFHEFEKVNWDSVKNMNIEPQTDIEKIGINDYSKEKKRDVIPHLSDTFLSLDQIKNEITNKIFGRFLIYVGILGGILGVISFISSYSKDFIEFRRKGKFELIQKNVIELEKKVDLYKNKLDSVNFEVAKLKDQ